MKQILCTMFELIVCRLDQVADYVDEGWPTKIVSLVTDPMPNYGPNHLLLEFHDIHRPMAGYVHPTPEHLQQILEFTKDLTEEDRVLVHCRQGISRSTAVAIGILMQHGMEVEDAFNFIKEQRPYMSPNRLIAGYLDEHFDLGGRLNALVGQAAEERDARRISEADQRQAALDYAIALSKPAEDLG